MNELEDTLERASAAMRGYSGRWWVGGGWAIDNWLGRQSRHHHDIDHIVLRADLAALARHLAGWTIWINEPDRFAPWDGTNLRLRDACLLARPDDGRELSWSEFSDHPSTLELMLEFSQEDTWIYRRDPRVQDHLHRLGPARAYLSPEIALLYKAPDWAVERNGADFDVIAPHLGTDRSLWLARALRLAHPGHPWVERLEA